MIAPLMMYLTIAGVLLACAAWLVERACVALHAPRRAVWAAAMLLMTIVPLLPASLVPRATLPSDGGVIAAERTSGITSLAESKASATRLTAISLRIHDALVWSQNLDTPLIVAWLLASTLLAGVTALDFRRLRRARRGWTLWRRASLFTPDTWFSDDIGPAAFGIAQGEIVIPRWAMALPAAELRLLMRHERAHVEARDPRLRFAAQLLTILLPWHLPLRWAHRRLQRAIEHDCDQRVLGDGRLVRRYADLLLHVAERALPRTPWQARLLEGTHAATGLTALVADRGLLEARLRALIAPATTTRDRVGAGAAACTALMLLAVLGVLPMPAPTPALVVLRTAPDWANRLGTTRDTAFLRPARHDGLARAGRSVDDSLYFARTDSMVIAALETSNPRLLRLAATEAPYVSIALTPDNRIIAHSIGGPERMTEAQDVAAEASRRATAAYDAGLPFLPASADAFAERMATLANQPMKYLDSLGISHLRVGDHPLTVLWIRLKQA
jgi:hypothetical protein